MMKKTAKAAMKTKVAIVLSALALATACSDSKDDSQGNSGSGGGGDVCVATPEACPVGQQSSNGYFIKSTRNGASLTDVLLIDFKAGFYGTNADTMYKNISGTEVIYNGEVAVSGAAVISFEDQRDHQGYGEGEEEVDLGFDGFGRTNNNGGSGRCRIQPGEYVITTLEKGGWTQRVSNSRSFAEIDSVGLQLTNGNNVIEATLEGASLDMRAEAQGGYLVLDGGRLSVQRYNGTRCSGINVNF